MFPAVRQMTFSLTSWLSVVPHQIRRHALASGSGRFMRSKGMSRRRACRGGPSGLPEFLSSRIFKLILNEIVVRSADLEVCRHVRPQAPSHHWHLNTHSLSTNCSAHTPKLETGQNPAFSNLHELPNPLKSTSRLQFEYSTKFAVRPRTGKHVSRQCVCG